MTSDVGLVTDSLLIVVAAVVSSGHHLFGLKLGHSTGKIMIKIRKKYGAASSSHRQAKTE